MHQGTQFRACSWCVGALSTVMLLFSTARAEVGVTQIATWYRNARAAYTLTMDDCRPSQVWTVEPAWTRRGLVGTFFINASDEIYYWARYKDDYLTFPAAGHELGSHTMEHLSVIPNDDRYPDACFASLEELDADCREFEALLMDLTGRETVSFAYPFGQEDAASREVIAQHYLSARDVAGCAEIHGFFVPNPMSPPDMYALDCFIAAGENPTWPGHDFSDYDTASSLFERYLTDTILAGGWGIEFSHGLSDGDRINRDAYYEHLDRIVELVAEGVLWNATQGDVSRYIYSRDAAEIELVSNKPHELTFVVDDGLDDHIFDVPLTIWTEVPAEWADADAVFVAQGQRTSTARLLPLMGTLLVNFEAPADGVPVRLFPWYAPVPIPGDLSRDGNVNSDDLDVVRAWWHEDVIFGDVSHGDANRDGTVNANDLNVVRSYWGYTSGTIHSAATVPEPAGAFLAVLGMACLAWRRRD